MAALDDRKASDDLTLGKHTLPEETDMLTPTKVIDLSLRDNNHCKRLDDPFQAGRFHLEAWLPFSEAAKLARGNANVRPPSERKKPFKAMEETVENDPKSFHIKNRGIIYCCDKFEFDNQRRLLKVSVPDVPPEDQEDVEPRFGIADGGHTFQVITQSVARLPELKQTPGWTEPFVRVHFLSGSDVIQGLDLVVEALNTSSQVQQYSIDEYQERFEDLKRALSARGFDAGLVGFRENEDKEWDVREMIHRMTCFLKERWRSSQPTQMYKSKGKALDLYTSPATHDEFVRLDDVIVDVVTMPEFIQAEFSERFAGNGKKFGKMSCTKLLKQPWKRPGTQYVTQHRMDLAASLPLAAAFRELLELKEGRYRWKYDFREVFDVCANDLYEVLRAKLRTVPAMTALGSDNEYWTQASNVVLRAKDEVRPLA